MDNADKVCAAGLARSWKVGDTLSHWELLPLMAILDVHVGRVQDASARLREGIRRDRTIRRGHHHVGRLHYAPRDG